MQAALSLGVVLISVLLGVEAEDKAGGGAGGFLVGVFAFGLAFLSRTFAIYPGSVKRVSEWGEKIREGGVSDLSTAQAVVLLFWFVGFGALVVYFEEFR